MLKANRSQKEAGDLLGTYMLQGWVNETALHCKPHMRPKPSFI